VSTEEWRAMREQALGTFLMMGTQWPAVLKRSVRGIQFFAHAPGFQGSKPEPESERHQLAKIIIAKALRAAGCAAWVECPGTTPDGEAWQADVLCQAGARMIAFEVQLANQTLEEYEARSARYSRSGVTCVWLVLVPKQYGTLAKSIYYRLHSQGAPIGARPSLSHLAALPLELSPPSSERAGDMRVVVFPEGAPRRFGLSEFVVGVAGAKLIYVSNEWSWRDPYRGRA
jgi:Competence protein CoiA-like family